MDLIVNGRPLSVDAATTVGQLVDAEVRERRGIAVAVDGDVIPRTDWDATVLATGARVELVGATQGG